ncbi:MAG: 23S rRNA (pseudouridine(1915)-N(3))-methyltransferase RlmH [Magnetovibrio sp.]|nr:23S rRNA (pseudouridine(1915)-N(3))-methyltransferase RlmH [Magnetovibrio sp.]
MQNVIVAVGRFKAGPEKALFDHFAGRLQPSLELREVEEKKRLSGDQLKNREAELLLAQVPKGAVTVALDGTGNALSSRQLAERLGGWRDDGRRHAAFLIGGADGLDASVLARAELTLSLGPQTWPHLMVRGMLAEQLYRAHSILAGHPYHRD